MTVQEANAKLMGDLKTVAQDAEELLKVTAGQTGEHVKELRTRLTAAIESARANCDRLQEKTAETAKAADKVIRNHPYESMGLAFGVGLLIGVLVGRR